MNETRLEVDEISSRFLYPDLQTNDQNDRCGRYDQRPQRSLVWHIPPCAYRSTLSPALDKKRIYLQLEADLTGLNVKGINCTELHFSDIVKLPIWKNTVLWKQCSICLSFCSAEKERLTYFRRIPLQQIRMPQKPLTTSLTSPNLQDIHTTPKTFTQPKRHPHNPNIQRHHKASLDIA